MSLSWTILYPSNAGGSSSKDISTRLTSGVLTPSYIPHVASAVATAAIANALQRRVRRFTGWRKMAKNRSAILAAKENAAKSIAAP